jgi:hypothetical protein
MFPYKWISVSVGLHHACGVFLREGAERRCENAVSPTANAFCWGDGAYGQVKVPLRPCGRLGKDQPCEWTRAPATLCYTIPWQHIR